MSAVGSTNNLKLRTSNGFHDRISAAEKLTETLGFAAKIIGLNLGRFNEQLKTKD